MKKAFSILAIGVFIGTPLRAEVTAPGASPIPAASSRAPQSYAYGAIQYGYIAPVRSRTGLEIGLLYATATLYGIGMGVWFSTAAHIDDPGLFSIAPAVLGLAAPAAVFVVDRSTFPRGVPTAIITGAIIGAGEGVGIVTAQFVTANREDEWGFRALAPATGIGATIGGLSGAVIGFSQRPSPRSSLFVSTSVFWGGAIGTMLGYGATRAGIGYGQANDGGAWGGLIGYNVGLLASAALSTVHVPTYSSLRWMWAGAGLGLVASLPVYLAYVGDGGPPAKRGLLFSGTASALGLVAGGLFTAGDHEDSAAIEPGSRGARITAVTPLVDSSSVGLAIAGEL